MPVKNEVMAKLLTMYLSGAAQAKLGQCWYRRKRHWSVFSTLPRRTGGAETPSRA